MSRVNWTLVALAVLVVAVFAQSYEARSQIVHSQRAGCERGKLDRASNASAWTAQRDYIGLVLQAKSVKSDVKRAARRARAVFQASSADLAARSRIDCDRAFRRPSLIP